MVSGLNEKTEAISPDMQKPHMPVETLLVCNIHSINADYMNFLV